jgi:hypothetical protein
MVPKLEKFFSLVKNGSQNKEGLLFEQIFFIKTTCVHLFVAILTRLFIKIL